MINDNGNYVSGGGSTDNRITIYPTQEKMQFELIETITLDADVSQIVRNKELDGTVYYFDSLFVTVTLPSAINQIMVYAIGNKSSNYVSIYQSFVNAKLHFQRVNGLTLTHAEYSTGTTNAANVSYPPIASQEDTGAIKSMVVQSINIPTGSVFQIYATRRHDL